MLGKIWKLEIPHGSMLPGFSPAGNSPISGVRQGPTRPLWVARSIGYMYSAGSSQRRVRAVELEVGTREAVVGDAHLRGHLLGVQGRHVVVLLEGVGEDLPVAVV